jgi:hypothetical protein
MKKLAAILVAVLSIPFLTLGLIFLVASGGSSSRFFTAVVLLAIGVVLLVWGVRSLRRLAATSEGALRTAAVELARRLGGELTVAQLRAEYRIPNELAQKVMDGLVSEGTAVPEQRSDRVVYVFKTLQPSIARKLCPYCGTELPVREAIRKCPNCGAHLEITKT